jgi:hypothetical protein
MAFYKAGLQTGNTRGRDICKSTTVVLVTCGKNAVRQSRLICVAWIGPI